ncbi:MAG: GFA family protein [Rhodobacteraceae bacterium]|nr:GFA family protein [Paracoccaceae bacterium]
MGDQTDYHDGGCLCGAIRYRARGPFVYSAHCHCHSCQRAVGAGITTWSGVKPENFEVTKGEITVYESSPGMERGFCNKCGSSLTGGGENWDDVAIASATLDNSEAATPTANVYASHKQSWIVLDEDLNTYPKFP